MFSRAAARLLVLTTAGGLLAGVVPAQALAAPAAAGHDDVVLSLTGHAADLRGAVSDVRGLGAHVRHDLSSHGAMTIGMTAGHAAAVRKQLARHGSVTVADVGKKSLATNDPQWSAQAAYLDQVHATTAWGITHGSSTVKVAIVDSGMLTSHVDLSSKVVAAHNAVDGTSDVTDALGHGTEVAGVAAAATDNSIGVAGTGFDTSLMAVKVADVNGDIWVDDEVTGIYWAADNGADVINLSLGSPVSDSTEAAAIAYAQNAGALVVAAAGNESTTAPSYPAAYPGVVAVGATDPSTGHRTSWSNHGSWVTLGAPGVGIWSTSNTGGYAAPDGTSFSSPMVAGAAALLIAKSPTATLAQIRNALVSSAQPLVGEDLGAGLLDMSGALGALPPTTTPAFTAPTAASTVSGDSVPLSVTSSGTDVQFYADDVPVGSTVPVATGIASTTADSWGLTSASHTFAAADCNAHGCGPKTTVAVTVDNAAPQLTAPPTTAVGDQVVTASSGAHVVRFVLNGGAPVYVTTDNGSASTSWDTFGLSNASHPVVATSCTVTHVCGEGVSTGLTVANVAPTITSGSVVQASTTFTATAPAGSGVRFYVDGVSKGFDGTSPYSLAYSSGTLADGNHTLKAVECNAAGTACAGPFAQQTFTVKALHPTIVSAVSPFSPNGDKVRDATTWVLRLADAEKVSYRITNAGGGTVGGPTAWASYAKGDHSFAWSGKSSSGAHWPDGVYTIKVSTSAVQNGKTITGIAMRNIVIDTVAPYYSAVVGASGWVYPVVDTYRDIVKLGVSVNESATVNLRISNSAGTVVRSAWVSRTGAGALAWSWNGRYANGTAVPAGTYSFRFVGHDPAGTSRTSGSYHVAVSWKRLVAKTAVITKNGSQAYQAGAFSEYDDGTDAGCSDASQIGTWMLLQNYCDPNDSYLPSYGFAAADYAFTVPGAITYTSLRVDTYGQSDNAPSPLEGRGLNYSAQIFDATRDVIVYNTNEAWTNGVCYIPVANHISGGVVKTRILVTEGSYGSADYTIEQVRLVVGYKVLQ